METDESTRVGLTRNPQRDSSILNAIPLSELRYGKNLRKVNLAPVPERLGKDIYLVKMVGSFTALVNMHGTAHDVESRQSSLESREGSGLQNLASLRTNLLILDFARFPATAEGFHQIDGAHHLLAE
jgi:hypothetical protein